MNTRMLEGLKQVSEVYRPFDDGVTHINVYSKSACKLGRMLSNFAHLPSGCEHGTFASVEGYWYWLHCDESSDRDRLRTLHGSQAKREGRTLRSQNSAPTDTHSPEFKARIVAALECKLRRHASPGGLLHRTTLPLTHYYTCGAPNNLRVKEGGHRWVIAALEQLRLTLQQEWGPLP